MASFLRVALAMVFVACCRAVTTYSGNCVVSTLLAGPPLAVPSGLAAFGSQILVTDAGNEIEGALFSVPLIGANPAATPLTSLVNPTDVAFSPSGTAYVAFGGTGGSPPTLLTLRIGSSAVSTLLGPGPVELAGLTFNTATGELYASDSAAHRIWAIVPSTGATRLVAGGGGPGQSGAGAIDGVGAAAAFNEPYGIAFDATSTTLYVADYENNLIRAVTAATGAVRTVAGNIASAGSPPDPRIGGNDATDPLLASFSNPSAIAVDEAGNLIVATFAPSDSRIRLITPAGITTTLAGQAGANQTLVDGPGNSATFNFPLGVTVAPSGAIIVADPGHLAIRVLQCNLSPAAPSPPPAPPAPAPAAGAFGDLGVGPVAGIIVSIALASLALGAGGAFLFCRRSAAPQPSFKAPPVAIEFSSISKDGAPSPARAAFVSPPLNDGATSPPLPGSTDGDPAPGASRAVLNPLEAMRAASAAGATSGNNSPREWGATASR